MLSVLKCGGGSETSKVDGEGAGHDLIVSGNCSLACDTGSTWSEASAAVDERPDGDRIGDRVPRIRGRAEQGRVVCGNGQLTAEEIEVLDIPGAGLDHCAGWIS